MAGPTNTIWQVGCVCGWLQSGTASSQLEASDMALAAQRDHQWEKHQRRLEDLRQQPVASQQTHSLEDLREQPLSLRRIHRCDRQGCPICGGPRA